MVLSGPSVFLEYRKIDIAQKSLKPQPDPKFDEMRRFVMDNSEVNITCHSWSDEADYFGICTDYGHIVVYNVMNEIVLAEKFEDYQFISIQLFESGLVAATNEGSMIFYELDTETKQYEIIRHW